MKSGWPIGRATAHTMPRGRLAVVLHEDVHRISTSIINFALSHGVILLASVIHHVPTKRPHSCLLKFLRILLLASCMNEIYGAYLEVTHRHDRD